MKNNCFKREKPIFRNSKYYLTNLPISDKNIAYPLLMWLPLFILAQLLLVNNISAQLPVDMLDYSRIPQKKIIKFIERQKMEGHELFSDFYTRCFREQDSVSYHKVTTSYLIHGKIEDVWKEYLNIRPSQAYTGRIVSFGFLYSKDDDQITYNNDPFEKMKVGQLYFFNLKLMRGVRNLGVADEVTAIDDDRKIIRFCYVDNCKTEGTQEIRLKPTIEGYTQITHDTWYKSSSRFRDRVLYPFFHSKSVSEFHHVIRDIVEGDKKMLSGTCIE
jgi:hypothetical protein